MYFGRSPEEIEEERKFYELPANRRLKYAALGSVAVAICMMLAMVIWWDDISLRVKLFMRGCVGLSAIVFVVLTGILVYRVQSRRLRFRNRR